MVASFSDLPPEIMESIVKDCGQKELLTLALTSKAISRIAVAKLYGDLYYRRVEKSDPAHSFGSAYDSDANGSDTDESDTERFYPSRRPSSDVSHIERVSTHNSWKCDFCSRKCSDIIFNDGQKDRAPIWIIDLHKFSKTISQHQDLRCLVHAIRLDVQSPRSWSREKDNLLTEQGTNPRAKLKTWSLNTKLEGAIKSLEHHLRHLRLHTRVFFTSECHTGCINPRSVLTIGQTSLILTIIPEFTVLSNSFRSQRTGHPRVYDLACPTRFRIEPAKAHSHLHQTAGITIAPVEESGVLQMLHYRGAVTRLENFLGAPQGPEDYRRWLSKRSMEELSGDSSRAQLLRILQGQLRWLDQEYLYESEHKVGNFVIGDVDFWSWAVAVMWGKSGDNP